MVPIGPRPVHAQYQYGLRRHSSDSCNSVETQLVSDAMRSAPWPELKVKTGEREPSLPHSGVLLGMARSNSKPITHSPRALKPAIRMLAEDFQGHRGPPGTHSSPSSTSTACSQASQSLSPGPLHSESPLEREADLQREVFHARGELTTACAQLSVMEAQHHQDQIENQQLLQQLQTVEAERDRLMRECTLLKRLNHRESSDFGQHTVFDMDVSVEQPHEQRQKKREQSMPAWW
eukprot:jgi/Astpho2/1515/Aster-05395